jgi:hypothetical protein
MNGCITESILCHVLSTERVEDVGLRYARYAPVGPWTRGLKYPQAASTLARLSLAAGSVSPLSQRAPRAWSGSFSSHHARGLLSLAMHPVSCRGRNQLPLAMHGPWSCRSGARQVSEPSWCAASSSKREQFPSLIASKRQKPVTCLHRPLPPRGSSFPP